MSGPAYPPTVTSGFDIWSTAISQYANAPILTQLIQNLQDYLDPNANLDAFYTDIWNIDTANGPGLDIWGRILGVERTLYVSAVSTFGFAEAVPGVEGFNTGTFYTGQAITQNYLMPDNVYRTLLLAKAAANITDGSIPAINQILTTVFPSPGGNYYLPVGYDAYYSPSSNIPSLVIDIPKQQYITDASGIITYYDKETPPSLILDFSRPVYAYDYDVFGGAYGQAYVEESPPMAIKYVFNFRLTTAQIAIIEQTGVLPKPTGTAATIVSL